MAPGKRGLQRGLKGRERTVILFEDEMIVTETPPLRAAWARVGHQAEVPMTGNRAKRVMYAVINVKTGHVLLHDSATWSQVDFQYLLRKIRQEWRGWRIVLFLDRGSPHTANDSKNLARNLKIELRWLPTACPELNAVDHLWRHTKADVSANEPTPKVMKTVSRIRDYITSLTPEERLRKAGVLSDDFWLRNVL